MWVHPCNQSRDTREGRGNPARRYNTDDKIYTRAGPVLIAVNPFKRVDLYTEQHMSEYRRGTAKDPHVYLVATKAYDEMVKAERNQAIIISGESGAGKTETTKIAMQYLATLAGGGGGIRSHARRARLLV